MLVLEKISQTGLRYKFLAEFEAITAHEDGNLWKLLNATPEAICRAALGVMDRLKKGDGGGSAPDAERTVAKSATVGGRGAALKEKNDDQA